MHRQGKGKDHDGQDPGGGKREYDLQHRPQAAVAVDQGLLLDVAGDRLEEAHQEPGTEGNGEGGIDEY